MGGIERALSVLANEWVKQGFSVVYVSCLKSEAFYELRPEIQVEEPTFIRAGGVVNKLFFYPKLISYIRKQIKAHQPDVVLSFGDAFNPLALLALRNTNIPIYISDRTSPDYHFKFPIPQLKKWLYPKATGFIAQTSRAATYRRKEYGPTLRMKVIPNALREVLLYPTIDRQKTILYVGRFAWEKAPDKLIRAFAKLKDADDWILKMAGSGPMLEEMKLLADELGVSNRVIFLGQVTNVDALYAEAGIYVLPSVLEGFPNSLCEAMAASLPSICFPTIPYEELFLKPGMGIVCKESNSESLAYELKILIKKNELRMQIGENAKMISQTLNVSEIGDQYLEFMNIK